jgi:hypothetical protein
VGLLGSLAPIAAEVNASLALGDPSINVRHGRRVEAFRGVLARPKSTLARGGQQAGDLLIMHFIELAPLAAVPRTIGTQRSFRISISSGEASTLTETMVARLARADGVMVSVDGTSLYHEGRAAGMIYQATLRRELHQSVGLEWAPVDPSIGMAELAGVDRDTITAWSRRSSQLREWATHNLQIVDQPLTAAQLAAAQKATRPAKPEELAWMQLVAQWRADPRSLRRSTRSAAHRSAHLLQHRAHPGCGREDRQGRVHPRRPR